MNMEIKTPSARIPSSLTAGTSLPMPICAFLHTGPYSTTEPPSLQNHPNGLLQQESLSCHNNPSLRVHLDEAGEGHAPQGPMSHTGGRPLGPSFRM